ncbi:MAG: maf [Pedosphaera sp.]|nr:maf [Pedosphaera sp.]
MNLPPLILASGSPRRSELLRGMGVSFSVLQSDAEEIHNEQMTATEISQLNAYRKARAVAKKFPDSLVLGADTLVYLGTTLFGKPRDAEDAYRMLKQLQGKKHEVVTGVCLLRLRGHRQTIFAESTEVKFRPLGVKEIRDYLSRINPLDKAGAYAIQEHGNKVVECISGSLSNVIGLPVERLSEELRAWENTQ